MTAQPPSTAVRRRPDRGGADPALVRAILDAAPLVHVATVRDGWPVVLPMAHARDQEHLYLHGSAAAGVFRDLRGGSPVCVTATLLDGLVLARSATNHSMNYRCAVVYGLAEPAPDPWAALRLVIEHQLPGRWEQIRQPSEAELRETGVWRVDLATASTKVRAGGPKDPPDDAVLPVWAGVLPISSRYAAAVPAEDLSPHAPPPPAPRITG